MGRTASNGGRGTALTAQGKEPAQHELEVCHGEQGDEHRDEDQDDGQ